jgi:hypothetical protein
MNFHLLNLALTSFYLKPFITENEESKFLSLRFVGNGKLQSLIAVFANGKVFGIADFSVETICHLALNDPSALSTAIKKLKFLKCNLDGDFPFIKALIYETPSLEKGMSKEIEHDNFNSGILLSIIMIDSKGILLQGSIGTTALLQNNPLTKICHDLLTKPDSKLCYPIPIQSLHKEGGCLDIAIKPSNITDLVTENLNNTNIVPPMIAIALYIDSSIAMINLSDNSISKVIYLNISSPLKILLIRNMSYPKERNTEGFLGDACILGIQSKSEETNAISLFALLNDKDDSQYYSYQLSSNMVPTNHIGTFNFLNLSIPGDLFLTIESYTGGNSVLSVLEISDEVDRCIHGIIAGLLLKDGNVKRDNHINEEISASILIGKIDLILFTLIESSDDEEDQSNPFREQEIIDQKSQEKYAEIILENIPLLKSCGEIGAVLNALFRVQNPPEDFIDKMMIVAEVILFWLYMLFLYYLLQLISIF